MRYQNKAGNIISQEKYDSMNPKTPAAQEVKDGYKPIPEPTVAKVKTKKKQTKKEDE